MSNETIRIIVDQASMGVDDAAATERYCELLAESVKACFPGADVSVESGEWNDGRIELSGFDFEDAAFYSIRAIKERVFSDGAWAV